MLLLRELCTEATLRMIDETEDETEDEEAQPPRRADGESQPLRVLVVDDNPDAAMSLGMLLQMSGHQAFIAHDGAEAIEAADQHRPDVVLLDLRLPGLDGHEVCRRIRRHAWGAGMSIIAVTGCGAPEDVHASHQAGFDGHIIKPLDFAALTNLIDALTCGEHGSRSE